MRQAAHMHKTCSVYGFDDYSWMAPSDASHGTLCVLSQCLGVVRTDGFDLGESETITIPNDSVNDDQKRLLSKSKADYTDYFDMDAIFQKAEISYEVDKIATPNPGLFTTILRHTSVQNSGFWILLEQMQLCCSSTASLAAWP